MSTFPIGVWVFWCQHFPPRHPQLWKHYFGRLLTFLYICDAWHMGTLENNSGLENTVKFKAVMQSGTNPEIFT